MNKLENVCLLEDAQEYFPREMKCVKMHYLIQDTALKNAAPSSLVKASLGLTELPDEDKWMENLENVSLMCNKI